MQNINDDNKNMQWQKHVVETILFTGKQYNFSLQTTYSSCLKKKKKKNLQDVYILQKFYLAS